MKKNILIICIGFTAISLMAFSWMKSDDCRSQAADRTELIADVNFLYDFGPRFEITVTKQELAEVKSMKDLYHEASIVLYKAVAITIVENERLTSKSASGENEILNKSQIEFLRSFEYSTNFQMGGDVVRKNKNTGELEDGFSRPHITVVPENEAEYLNGKESFLDYLKRGSKTQIANLEVKKLQPGKVFFTITENGTITDVKLLLTCGYNSIDKLMINLITNAAGKWKPASNANGKIVEQELVFSFGDMGC
ncbi:MAG: hypothetical protein JKX84_02555 [Flavobacteriales bacterium]|nr:hypothetical protein [Flavobacteriales bacterium]